jgi:hypothetical protein
VKAIPTTYQGVEFRSRLEARVAMAMDHERIEWHYEPEGFELDDGTRYMPDFWLPRTQTWIEVKFSYQAPGVDKAKKFAQAVCGFDDYGDGNYLQPEQLVMVMHPTKLGVTERLVGLNALGASTVFVECPSCLSRHWTNIGAWECRSCDYNFIDEAHKESFGGGCVLFGGMDLPRLPQWRPKR